MADSKISNLSSLSPPAGEDLIPVVDVSDTSMDAAGTDKRVTVDDLDAALPIRSEFEDHAADTLLHSSGQLLGSTVLNGISNQAITTEADITSATLTITVDTRPIAIFFEACFLKDATSADVNLNLFEGASKLRARPHGLIASRTGSISGFAILTPSAGSHTYKLRASSASGTVTVLHNSGLFYTQLIALSC